MTTINVTREQLFDMGGVAKVDGAYTPVSIGKGNKVRDGNRAWIQSMKKLNFTNAGELVQLSPENVSKGDVIVPIMKEDDFGKEYFDEKNVIPNYKAIVGDTTHKVYSIKSNRYNIVQHKEILDAFAQASESTGIDVFGRMEVNNGIMHASAFFADPDCQIDLSGQHSDPVMLGFNVYNSHNGTTGFGGNVIGIRYLCSNLMAFGETLGSCKWKHSVKMEDVTASFEAIIKTYMEKVPPLQDRIHQMHDEVLTVDEAECALWGIKLSPSKIESITTYMPELAQEIDMGNGKVSLYDAWNASNAYVTYSNTGAGLENRFGDIDSIEGLVTKNIDKLINLGADRREEYRKQQEQKRIIDLTKTDDIAIIND